MDVILIATSFDLFSSPSKGIDYHGYEILLFLLMGVIGGLLGALFNAINHKITVFRMK